MKTIKGILEVEQSNGFNKKFNVDVEIHSNRLTIPDTRYNIPLHRCEVFRQSGEIRFAAGGTTYSLYIFDNGSEAWKRLALAVEDLY
jgi:hypothetical protein